MERIGVLPDDVLLDIFDFYEGMNRKKGPEPLVVEKTRVEAWQLLVHVCRRWRSVVFQSSSRLNLHLYCTAETPARDTLDVWPALPLLIGAHGSSMTSTPGMDNIIVALGQSNRVRQVALWGLVDWQLEKVLAAMHVPFPELIILDLAPDKKTLPVIPIPDSFLGGSASRLKHFELSGIPFPGLPKLVLSATHLVRLHLSDIPHSGYISPEAIVAVLSALSNLEIFSLRFRSPQSRPDRESRILLPPKRSILTSLNRFGFKGVTEYLEDLLTFIDVPHLDYMEIDFFNQVDFDCPRLARFINRTPSLRALDEAHVHFNDISASVGLRYRPSESGSNNILIDISCREPDWQLSSVEQVCNFPLRPLFTVEDLYIEHRYSKLVWKNDAIENFLWLQLLLPFTAVKNLHLSKEFAPGIAVALLDVVGDRITVVMPSLQNIFVEALEPSGPFQENIAQFVTARQLSGLPVAISAWNKGEVGEGSASSCMHSALVSIGRDADIFILVCAQRRNWGGFFGSIYELGSATEVRSIGPQVSPQGQEERQGPKGSVDLAQHVCLDDTGQLQYLLNCHDVVVHFALL